MKEECQGDVIELLTVYTVHRQQISTRARLANSNRVYSMLLFCFVLFCFTCRVLSAAEEGMSCNIVSCLYISYRYIHSLVSSTAAIMLARHIKQCGRSVLHPSHGCLSACWIHVPLEINSIQPLSRITGTSRHACGYTWYLVLLLLCTARWASIMLPTD